ncbi:hypothetical protein [Gordonia polyisoprenivorans]|uniref:hypothetical protein n=1 Tax=Gordonia polyisoprenivorans TaxID=84595 RepID=UPI001AD64309|nr:hypothetical protein [Gordonia polyisoprenivorans]QTI66874.1 hypothetical protein J6U32_14465 [Gordonia polyisoprenivorans]
MSTTAISHPRDRTMAAWRSRLGVLASRGETSGPRVDECRAALSWYRLRAALDREVRAGYLDPNRADDLLEGAVGAMT